MTSISVNIVWLTGPLDVFFEEPQGSLDHTLRISGIKTSSKEFVFCGKQFEHRWSLSISTGLIIKSGWDVGPGGQLHISQVQHWKMKWPRVAVDIRNKVVDIYKTHHHRRAENRSLGFIPFSFISLFLGLFIYFEKEGWWGEMGRERERESQAGSNAVSTEPDVGLSLRNCEILTRAEIKNWMLNWKNHPGAPNVNLDWFKLNRNYSIP